MNFRNGGSAKETFPNELIAAPRNCLIHFSDHRITSSITARETVCVCAETARLRHHGKAGDGWAQFGQCGVIEARKVSCDLANGVPPAFRRLPA